MERREAATKMIRLQPRFVLGLMLTVLSFAALLNHERARADEVTRVKKHAVEYFDNVRFIYRVVRRLNDLQKQEASEGGRVRGRHEAIRCPKNEVQLRFETSERGLPLFARWDPSSHPRS